MVVLVADGQRSQASSRPLFAMLAAGGLIVLTVQCLSAMDSKQVALFMTTNS